MRASKCHNRELVGSLSLELLKTQWDEAVTFNVAWKLALFRAGVLANMNYSMKNHVSTVEGSAAHPASGLPLSSLPCVRFDKVSMRRSREKRLFNCFF